LKEKDGKRSWIFQAAIEIFAKSDLEEPRKIPFRIELMPVSISYTHEYKVDVIAVTERRPIETLGH
jgi:hypothetical protein